MKKARMYTFFMNGTTKIEEVTVDMESREILAPVDEDAFQVALHVDGEAYRVVGNRF